MFCALAFCPFLGLLADRLELPGGLRSHLLLTRGVLRQGLAEGVRLRLGGGQPRSAASEVVVRLGERGLGVGTPARRVPPGVERGSGAQRQRHERNEGRAFDRRGDAQDDDQQRCGRKEGPNRDPRLQAFPIALIHDVTW